MAAQLGAAWPEDAAPCDQLAGRATSWHHQDCRGDSGAVMWGVCTHPSLPLCLERVAEVLDRQAGEGRGQPDSEPCAVALYDAGGTHRSPALATALALALELRGYSTRTEHLAPAFTTNVECQCSQYPAGQGRWCHRVSRNCGKDQHSQWPPRETAVWLHNEQARRRTDAVQQVLNTAAPVFRRVGLPW